MFSVSDGNGGTIGHTTFAITVNPMDDEPVLGAIGPRGVDEGDTLQINLSSSDSNAGDTTDAITLTDDGTTTNGVSRIAAPAVRKPSISSIRPAR